MLTDLLFRLRAVFRRKAMEDELDQEMRFHFDQHVEKGLRSGLSREEASRLARIAFGGREQVKEECRQARGVSLLETTLQDFRYALRMLRKGPGFAAAVVVTLALGIGANTAIFSLLDAVLWRMLPVERPQDLVLIGRTQQGATGTAYGYDYRTYRRLRDQNSVLTDIAAYSPVRINVSVNGGMEPAALAHLVTGTYFSVLGVRPAIGRAIGLEDDQAPNAHPVVMLSDSYWKRRFGSDQGVIGREITLCGATFTVIGVTPPEFFGIEVGSSPDFFAPVMMQPALMPASENLLDRPILNAQWLRVVGRVKPGVDSRQAAAAMTVLLSQEQAVDKRTRQPIVERISLDSAATGLSGLRSQFSKPLFILLAMVGVVLLIACANIANLLLAKAAARRSEFAVRLAVGAGGGRLIRQLLVESVSLALLGGVCGVLLARWATQFLVAYMSSGRTPIVLDLEPDLRVLGFTAAVSLATGILFGLAPALRATRIDVAPAMKGQTGGGTGGRHALRPGRILAVAQVALSLLLLISALLFVRSLQKLNSQDHGFPRDSVVMIRVEPRGSDQRGVPGTSERVDRIYKDLLERVSSIPGVRAASMAHFTPTARIGFSGPLRLPGGEEMRISRLMVYANYFATMGIPVIGGRDFNAGDLSETSPYVAVVNEAFARQAFHGENPVGKQFFTSAGRRGQVPVEIIGLVRDSRYANLRGETPPVIYQPFFQTNTGRGQMILHVRVAGPSSLVLPRIREEVQKIDKDLPLFDVRTLAAELDATLIQERLMATISGFFGILAVLLACVGLYGLLAFAVVQRTGEMGIRMALGASRGDVVWMVMRDAMVLLLAGIAIGVPVALGVARLASSQISGLLYGLTATDPITISAAILTMALAAALAGYLPARRASRVDPMAALRNE